MKKTSSAQAILSQKQKSVMGIMAKASCWLPEILSPGTWAPTTSETFHVGYGVHCPPAISSHPRLLFPSACCSFCTKPMSLNMYKQPM